MQKPIIVSRGEYIWKNPNTKQGRESYVRYDYRARGWVYDFGQAYSTMKFRKDINVAIDDMRNTEVFGKNKIPNGIFQERMPHCWYCNKPADNHHEKLSMGKTIEEFWVCDEHMKEHHSNEAI